MNDYSDHVRVLAVSSNDADLLVLCRILSHSAWMVLSARSLTEARDVLNQEHVHVVLSDRRLQDGTWKEMLDFSAILPDPPQVIVISRDGDERLWGEVLNCGAWDVLLKPFHPKEVFRTIHAAWQHAAAGGRALAEQKPPASGKSAQAAVVASAK